MKTIITIMALLFCIGQTQAQTLCDSMNIVKVLYEPFNDSIVQVKASYRGDTFIHYPRFVMYSQLGDTQATEAVNFFGMMQESIHNLDAKVSLSTTFPGRLVLYSLDTEVCSFAMNMDLCPDTCQTVYPYLMNNGNGFLEDTVKWIIQNKQLQTVATGQWAFGPFQQYVLDTVCLTPGNYTLKVVSGTTGTATDPTIGMMGEGQVNSSFPPKQYTGVNTLVPFTFFKKCIATTSIENKEKENSIKVYAAGKRIDIAATSGKPIGEAVVFSIDGKVIHKALMTNTHDSIVLQNVPSGIYIINIKHEGAIMNQKLVLRQD